MSKTPVNLDPRAHRRRLLAVALVALVGLVVMTGSARADGGSYTVSASGDAICNLGQFGVNVSGFVTNCGPGIAISAPPGGSAETDTATWTVSVPNSGLSITGVTLDDVTTYGVNENAAGLYYGAGFSLAGGDSFFDSNDTNADTNENGAPFSLAGKGSSVDLFLQCDDGDGCASTGSDNDPGELVGAISMSVLESQNPSIQTNSGANLLAENGQWVWNAQSDPWPVPITGTDPSGICELKVTTLMPGGQPQSADASQPMNSAAFQQCPNSWIYSPTIDTEKFANGAGTLSVTGVATDAAGNTTSTGTAAVNVDNQPPRVSITQLNDTNPTGAGDNAAAQLQITPTVGPSGISSFSCTVDGQSAGTPPADPDAPGSYLLDLDDSTSHTVACTVQNNAVNPQGQYNSATSTYTVPAYDTSAVSFAKIADPLVKRKVKERVRVGYHYATRRLKDGKEVRVKVGGHFVTKTVTRYVEHCATKIVTVKVKGKTRKERKRVCAKPSTHYQDTVLVGHGKSTLLYGELSDAQGALAGQSVTILSTPISGGSATIVGTVTTAANGSWIARIPAGPSRTITAAYGGDSTQLPSSASATVNVPARIRISASPRRLPWSGVVRIKGQLKGGFIPPDGVALRLLIKLPGSKRPYVPEAFRTTRTGSFDLTFTWHRGSGVATYPMYVATTGNESDYPFAAADSPKIKVTFGLPTPRRTTKTKTGRH